MAPLYEHAKARVMFLATDQPKNNVMKYKIMKLLLILVVIVNCNNVKPKINKDSIEINESDIFLFKDSIWELAQLVEKEDTSKFLAVIKKYKYDINTRENRYKQTLLIWAVINNKIKSVKKLLQLSANPNLFCELDDGSALIIASAKADTTYISLLLEFKADPNLVNPNTNKVNGTALESSIRNDKINNLKILLNYNANLYLKHKFSMFYVIPLRSAFNEERINIVSYLIFNKIIDIKKPLLIRSDSSNFYITHALRNWLFPIESEKYKQKMKIVDYLKKHGMDYWKTEIPRDYYDNYSKEYLSKY